MNPARICTVCFIAVIVLGVGFIAVGVLLIPTLPYVQLDAVLSPEELADPQIHDATLAMLKKASGNQGLIWTLAGVLLCVIGGLGLRASRQMQRFTEKKDASRIPPRPAGTI